MWGGGMVPIVALMSEAFFTSAWVSESTQRTVPCSRVVFSCNWMGGTMVFVDLGVGV